MAANLVHAYNQDNDWVHVSNVENGLKCNCLCPACCAPLIAKNQGSRTHHFSHYSGTSCINAPETAIHKLAKQIILENDYLVSRNRERIWYYHAQAEKSIGGLRPDVILETENGKFLLEIFVSNKVSPRKADLIRKLGIPAMEIDLSKLEREISKAELEKYVLEYRLNRTMIMEAASIQVKIPEPVPFSDERVPEGGTKEEEFQIQVPDPMEWIQKALMFLMLVFVVGLLFGRSNDD